MVLWGVWVLVALTNPAHPGSSLVLGLAVVAAALFLLLRAPLAPARGSSGVVAFARRARTSPPPRLVDPDAAGRPRPRAPSVCPAA